MLKIFYLIIFISLNAVAKPNVCVFSLNSESEPQAFKKFFDKNVNVSFHNPIKKNSFAKNSFNNFVDDMVAKKQSCDMMVFSGHHSGSFWGEKVFDSINLQDIYKMSCDPKYASFFENIKAWWLLGCQTDGFNIRSAEEEADRLLRECNRDENPEYCDYSQNLITYGALFDKDAPYLSSLQSISPKSFMFAYTKKAPLSPSSHHTFQRQFQKTAAVLSQELVSVEQELKAEGLNYQIPAYVTDINKLVHRLMDSNSDRCQNCSDVSDEQFESALVKGWNQHMQGDPRGNDYYKPNALPPFDKTAKTCSYKGSQLLNKDVLTKLPKDELVSCHHDIDCMLMNQVEGLQCIKNNKPDCTGKYNLDTTKKLLDVITNSNNKEAFSVFAKSFNNVESLIRELRLVKPNDWKSSVKPMLVNNYKENNSLLKNYFETKINPSPSLKSDPEFVETSVLRKMAIYSVEKAILEGTSEQAAADLHQRNINSKISELLTSSKLAKSEFNDYRQELVRASYFYEIKDISNLNSSNLPEGVQLVNGSFRFTDPSQAVGIVEHLSNKDQLSLKDSDRQKVLYDFISKVSMTDLKKLNDKQKADYYSSFNAISDSSLVRKRNQLIVERYSPDSVWGLDGFFKTASGTELDNLFGKINTRSLSQIERNILITSISKASQDSSKMGAFVNSLQSDDLDSAKDAQLYSALQNSNDAFERAKFSIYIQDKLKTKKYQKPQMLNNIQYNLGLTPNKSYELGVKFLALTKDYDTAHDSCAYYRGLKRTYHEKFSIDTSQHTIPGC